MSNIEASPTGTSNILQMLNDRVENLLEEGKTKEAGKSATAAINRARELHQDAWESGVDLALCLESQGDVFLFTGNLQPGRESYEEALALLEEASKSTDSEEDQGRIAASMAVLNDKDEAPVEARHYYERAIAHFRRLDPPALLDIADMNNNLAFYHEAEGENDKAEALLLEALEIAREELGPDDEQTGALSNNLGGLYYKTGRFKEALQLHKMALEARQASLGDRDADTAQSHANLALVYLATDEFGLARHEFEQSLSIYEKLIATNASDYATVVSNYTEFLKEQGEQKEVVALEKRAHNRLRNS